MFIRIQATHLLECQRVAFKVGIYLLKVAVETLKQYVKSVQLKQ